METSNLKPEPIMREPQIILISTKITQLWEKYYLVSLAMSFVTKIF